MQAEDLQQNDHYIPSVLPLPLQLIAQYCDEEDVVEFSTEAESEELDLNSDTLHPHCEPSTSYAQPTEHLSPERNTDAPVNTENTPEKDVYALLGHSTLGENRKRNISAKRLVNTASWNTVIYEQALYTYTEVAEKYDVISTHVLLKDLPRYLKGNPFLSTGFHRKDKYLSVRVKSLNRHMGAELRKFNPLDTLDWTLELPEPPPKYLFTQYYSGCLDPVCTFYSSGDKPCTANIKISVNSDALSCTIFARGKHCEHYRPIHNHLIRRPEINDIIRKNLQDTPVVLLQKLRKQVPDIVISKNQVRQAKYNTQRANRINNGNPLGGAITYVRGRTGWVLLPTIGENAVANMQNDNFTLVLIHVPTWQSCANYFNDIIGLDGVHKCLKLSFIEKDNGKIPLYVLTCSDTELKTQVPVVMLSTNHNAQTWADCLRAIGVQYEKDFNRKWTPYFMIDDGSVEKSCMEKIGANYFICKFHIVQRWTHHLNSMGLSETEKAKLYNTLLSMFAAPTETAYLAIYRSMRQRFPVAKYGSFLRYFDSNWHQYGGDSQFYLRWISAYRACSYGLWNTNNATERVMKDIQLHLDHRSVKNLEKYVVEITDYIEARAFNTRTNKSVTEVDAERRCKDGFAIWSNERNTRWAPSTSKGVCGFAAEEQATDDQSSFLYSTNLEVMTCNCLDYVNNCRPCKHLFCTMFEYAHLHELPLSANPEKSPFQLIRLIANHIHERSTVNIGSRAASAWPAYRMASNPRMTAARQLHETARAEASSSYLNQLQQQYEEDVEAQVIGIRSKNSMLEIKIKRSDLGAQWKPLSSVHNDALVIFLDDLDEYLNTLRASNSLNVTVHTIVLTNLEYLCSYDEVEDIPLSRQCKTSCMKLFAKF